MKSFPRIGLASALSLTSACMVGCGTLSGLDQLSFTSCTDACDGGADGSSENDSAVRADAALDSRAESSTVETPTGDSADAVSTSADAPSSDVAIVGDAAVDAADATPAGTGADAHGDANADGGNMVAGLVAFYPFDEASGTTSVDASGNGHTATMQGATFASGLHGNAATMDGTNQYVNLPSGIVSGLSSVSIAAWVRLVATPTWNRVFDFGTGTTAYMFLTPNSMGAGTTRFTITTNGTNGQQNTDGPKLPTNSWQHVCVTLTAGAPYSTSVLYINGIQVGQNAVTTVTPADLGNTTSNWLGRSHAAVDPFFNGQIDNFRIYSRPLSASEIQQLFQQQL